jgi:predicted adenine nucleotide alpha hydrolase (AANH) superfamily ATPase
MNIDFKVPGNHKAVLIHSCCAPCSGPLIEKMHQAGIELTIFFYNPNIHPKQEYEIRKNENKRFADKLKIPFVDADYDLQNWFAKAKGMEHEPERGIRCTMCFDMRFLATAKYASSKGFKVFASSLGISRWKNMHQINDCGIKAAKEYEDLVYWTYNWRKEGGAERMYELAKEENFYKQRYCGCIYSLRDTNNWHEKNNRPKIEIGQDFYSFEQDVKNTRNN